MTAHNSLQALYYCDKLLLLSEGKVLAELFPGTDVLPEMEQMLEMIMVRSGCIGAAHAPESPQ